MVRFRCERWPTLPGCFAGPDLGRYGIGIGTPALDYGRLLARTNEVVTDVRERSAFREHIDRLGVTLHERTGTARFVDPHTIETDSGLRLHADRVILCAGGRSRRLPVPGAEWTPTHSDAWSLTDVPDSMIVVGAGMTGVQVASIFQTFGSRVSLFQTGPRILPSEDEEVSAAVAAGFRASGMVVREGFGAIDSVEKTATGVRMTFSKNGVGDAAEAALIVVAIGWIADADGLNLDVAGVERDARGYVAVDQVPADVGAARLRRRRHDRPLDAGAPGGARRLDCGHQRREGPNPPAR